MNLYAVSVDCLKLTKAWEGRVAHWYRDIAGIETGGYGHVRLATDHPGPGEPFTEDVMTAWLTSDMAKAVRAVNGLGIDAYELGQHRGDALADACFNCGVGLLSPGNTITKRLLARDWTGAADALLEWCHARINGVVQVNQGLLSRRKAERALFLSPDAPLPDVSGYSVCTAGAICNPDEIREIMAEIASAARIGLADDPSVGLSHTD